MKRRDDDMIYCIESLGKAISLENTDDDESE